MLIGGIAPVPASLNVPWKSILSLSRWKVGARGSAARGRHDAALRLGAELPRALEGHDLAGVERIADRVGILKDGRLLLAEETEALKARYRAVRYRSEVTESRTDFGNELDEMEPVRAKVRGWGIEAVVWGFSEERFERFAQADGIVDAEASPLSLEELFLAVAGEPNGGAR